MTPKERKEKAILRQQEIVSQAKKENRDLTAEERDSFGSRKRAEQSDSERSSGQ